MAKDPHVVEEDYIAMDILCYKLPSPPHSTEFEFQMSSNNLQTDHVPSPADELFYKGNLLPLHLPPRLQMVEKILQNPQNSFHKGFNTNTTTNTPFESCNISPATSCYVSGELNPEEFFDECRKETKKSWSKKLNLKLKASKAYLKSLFTKTGCNSNETLVVSSKTKKSPFEQIQRAASFMKRFDAERNVEEECGHRRSFSSAIKRHASNKSSSTSSLCSSSNSSSFSSGNSNGIMLKRSSSVNSENECSIQGAIAYCKKSQQLACGRKSVSDVEFYLLAESGIDAECEKQEKEEICKG